MPADTRVQRRSLLAMAAAPLAGSGWATATVWPRAEPADVGLDAQLAAQLDDAVRAGELANLHAVTVVRRGRLAVERYYAGTDERWGQPLGRVDFTADTLHDLRSVSKSIVGLLYGIALAEGKVPAPDAALIASFSAYKDLAAQPERRRLTVAHALSMTLGTQWNEDLPYTDPRNSEIAMERAVDRYRYVLEQPLVAEPGSRWIYNGGATAVLGHLIARGTGQALDRYAQARLFAPVGIEHFDWSAGSNGEPSAASGLRLRPTDLARIGQLLLQRGRWRDAQVVPADWITASLTPRASAFEGVRYGYHWYLAQGRDAAPYAMALGNGGQRLVVLPSLDLVLTVLTGNYNRADQLKVPLAVTRLVAAAIR